MSEDFIKKKQNNNSIKRFIRLLKEKDAFYAFRRNYDVFFYSKNSFAQPDKTCRQYLDNVPAWNFIVYAFHWIDSVEGYGFWNDLNIEWRNIIRVEKL
jgi:hypothetical protein